MGGAHDGVSLSDDSIEKLVDLPETGMGFQLVSASWRGESAVLIVLNAELAFICRK